jgi:hypothetical protein
VLQFCNKEKKHKDLIIPLAREFAKAAKATGKSEQMVNNIHRDFADAEKSWGKVPVLRNSVCDRNHGMLGKVCCAENVFRILWLKPKNSLCTNFFIKN